MTRTGRDWGFGIGDSGRGARGSEPGASRTPTSVGVGFSRAHRGLRAARLALFLLGPCAVLLPPTLDAQQPQPRRIISLVPSVTETLFAMGAGPRVAAVSSFDQFPAEVGTLPRVGALFDPDVERILSLRPDLVIVYGSQTDLKARLARASIPMYEYRHGSLADVTGSIRDLGARIGMPDEARALAAEIDAAFVDIRTRLKGAPRPQTMLVIGREPGSLRAINVSGGFGFLHDLLELAGGANVFADVKRESMLVSTETILARAPDAIIELHYSEPPTPASVERERKVWHLLPGVPAVKANRVHLLYGGELVVPGPRVVLTARTFARALHPELGPWGDR